MAKEFPVSFNRMDGGVNYSLPQNLIPDNDLAGALNFFYDPITGQAMTRDGVTRYSSDAAGTDPDGIFYSSILDKILVSDDGTLYYLDPTTKAFTSIGALSGSGKPHFLDFNSKVLVASGGQLQATDGVTIGVAHATAPESYKIMAKDGRVFSAGDSTYPHRIFGSAPGDETDWDSVAGDAVYFDVDLNVGDGITDFNIYANDIVVFKGPEQRGIYRIVVPEGDYAAAYIKQDSMIASSINWHTSINANNNLYFLDNNGWHSLKGIIAYGDIEQDPIGAKINGVIIPTIDKATAFLFANPYYSQIWVVYANVDTVYAFHWLQNGGKGAFMPQKFKDLNVLSACYMEDDRTLLLGMSDGYVYKLDNTTTQDNGVDVPGLIRTKMVALKDSNTIKRLLQTTFTYEGFSSGTATLEAVYNNGQNTASLISATLDTYSELLYEADGYLNDATGLLYGKSLRSYVSRKLLWHYDIQYLVSVSSGGLKINRLEALMNIWGRRQA